MAHNNATPADPHDARTTDDQDSHGESGRDAEPRHVDDVYDPSREEVNRARVQGVGMGQKDLDYQRDPTGAASSEQFSREPEKGPKKH
jgi:hypothetical protein